MVVPSEIFHIAYAQSIRSYLVDQCSRILFLDPAEIWLADTLQGTVLLLAEKKRRVGESSQGVAVAPIQNRACLTLPADEYFRNASYASGATIAGKWMSVFLSKDDRALMEQLQRHPQVKLFADLASVDVGIVTGANKFFLVPDNTVDEFALHHWAFPMFGRVGTFVD